MVERLSEMLSIPKERIATIGDGANDALMFRKSGFSIAMGNASDRGEEAGDGGHRHERAGRLRQGRPPLHPGRGRNDAGAGALRVFDDAQALARGAAEFLCETAERSAGRFVVSLCRRIDAQSRCTSISRRRRCAPACPGIASTGSRATSASCCARSGRAISA